MEREDGLECEKGGKGEGGGGICRGEWRCGRVKCDGKWRRRVQCTGRKETERPHSSWAETHLTHSFLFFFFPSKERKQKVK